MESHPYKKHRGEEVPPPTPIDSASPQRWLQTYSQHQTTVTGRQPLATQHNSIFYSLQNRVSVPSVPSCGKILETGKP
jgi:hypothetical protein